jgi:hypothetical protein
MEVAQIHKIINYSFLATDYAYTAFTNKGSEQKTGTTKASSLQLITFILLKYSQL